MKKYWTQETTQALREYQSADIDGRNAIFEETILPALDKMVECIINMSSKYKPVDLNQLRLDTISHLTLHLDRLDTNKNPFGYLTLTAKHFVYQYLTKRHKLDTRDISLSTNRADGEDCSVDLIESQLQYMSTPSVLDSVDLDHLKEVTLAYWDVERLKKHIWNSKVKEKRQLFNRCKYYLYRMQSPHIKIHDVPRAYRNHLKVSRKVATETLSILTEPSLKLLDE